MIKKLSLFTLLLSSSIFALEIPIQHAQTRLLNKSVALNSQVIQLSNASQVVTSLVAGHLEKYFISAGEQVKKGQKIALIESIEVSKMTANYIALKKQYEAQAKNYEATQNLYKDGMTSLVKRNNESMKKDALLSQINALKSQLSTLNIQVNALKKATPNFILYAHSSGVVAKLLQPLHTGIRVDESIISIIQEQAFYIKSFLPLEYAQFAKVGQKLVVKSGSQTIVTHVKQILPSVDTQTQRIVLLSSVDTKIENLFINAYLASKLYFGEGKKYVTVEKSALSFFKNEWVVFVPKHEEEHEVAYEARVVTLLNEDEQFVAIRGLEDGEEYVSDKSYYVKSLMLKSSLGGHGH